MSDLIDIIIVNWNGRHLMQQCLPSVLDTEFADFSVVVADNASTDDSVDWLRAEHPEVRIIQHDENHGFARGNNLAIKETSSRYVVLLNNDVEVDPHWLELMYRCAESDDSIAAVTPKLLQHQHRTTFEYSGACGGFVDELGYPFARGRIFDTLEVDDGQYDDRVDVFWGSGAALLLRRSSLQVCGLLDEAFFMHMEEIDLCWRLRAHGYRVICEPAARVYHVGGASLAPTDPSKVYYNFRNSLLTLYKNGGRHEWPRRFGVRALLDSCAFTRFLLTGRGRSAWAIVRAYLDAHRMKRAYVPLRSARDKYPPPYRGSIVVDYFLRRRKTFASLPKSHFDDWSTSAAVQGSVSVQAAGDSDAP